MTTSACFYVPCLLTQDKQENMSAGSYVADNLKKACFPLSTALQTSLRSETTDMKTQSNFNILIAKYDSKAACLCTELSCLVHRRISQGKRWKCCTRFPFFLTVKQNNRKKAPKL